MGPTGFFVEFIVAAAVGGLIGVEREHRADKATVIAGVRTFPLVSVAGFLAAFLSIQMESPWVLAAGVLGVFLFAVMFIHMRAGLGQTGVTTPIAMVVTFLLGAIIGFGYTFEAVVVGVVSTFLLLTKQRLHRFAKVLDDTEILSALQFITIVFILLPLTAGVQLGEVPYASWMGRGGLIDPYAILLVVVFVSSISFVSLLAMRQVGTGRGLEFSGLLGGLVNSEATTAALAQRAREAPALVAAAVVGSILASTTMVVRNLAIAGFADPSQRFLLGLLPFVLPVALVGGVMAWRSRGARGEAPQVALRVGNPFAIWPALRFALFFAGVSLLVEVAQTRLGEAGVYIASLGGFVSAGAVIASLAALATTGGVSLDLAIRTAVLAVAASVLGKLFILRAIDQDTFRRARTSFLVMTGVAFAGVAAAFLLG